MGRTGDRNITDLARQYMTIAAERRSMETLSDSWRTRVERHRSDYVLDIVNRRSDAAQFKLKRQGRCPAQDQWNRGMWGTLLLTALTVTPEEQKEYASTSPNAKHGARLVAIIDPERLVVQRTIDAPGPGTYEVLYVEGKRGDLHDTGYAW
ncbi:hypothetical protein [Bifidobacterium miconisargentati]|uniref:hypothetical protein n=1 Tax=Bifidobacterium miconisargentati TaxID=2834437 RepID=UPI001BDC26AB|nr:hypothetical protein [Bifidobacterium miconisargentati]MBW3091207.1 hypothetical protein [Bifidobacterium miconisargentati]